MRRQQGLLVLIWHRARIWLLALAAALLFAALGSLVWLRMYDGHALSVQSGSMAPTFRPGDAVVTKKVPLSSLQAGQIISYRSPANLRIIITHRLVRINQANGRLTTRGDHLSWADSPFSPQLVVGRVIAILPQGGTLLDAVHRPLGLIVGVYLPVLIIIGNEAMRLFRHYARPQYRLGEAR